MAKFTTYQCEKCGLEIQNPRLPSGWRIAEIRSSDFHEDIIGDWIWCAECWEKIHIREKKQVAEALGV